MLSSKINQNCQSCLCRRIISILQNWSRLIGTTQTPVFHWFTEICKTNFKFSIYSFSPIPPKQALLFIQLMANWVKNWSPRRFLVYRRQGNVVLKGSAAWIETISSLIGFLRQFNVSQRSGFKRPEAKQTASLKKRIARTVPGELAACLA